MVLKRSFDIVVSLLLLVVLAPLFAVVALAVLVSHGPPVFFRQRRPGHKGRPFLIVKFRTMADLRAPDGRLLPDEVRLTRLGRWLRSASLDELPALWNVLRGDMSLVGPRPLLMEYLPLYSAEQARRHDLRPGITGWAQIRGRNLLSWEDRFALDVWYVDNRSFWLDLQILFATIGKVLRREGISQKNHVTMEPFRGNRP